MKFLRLTILTVVLVGYSTDNLAQKTTCTLKQAPEFNGFRLGMTLPDVKDKLADSSMFDSKTTAGNKIGAQAVRISGAELKDEYAEGIDDIHLTFVDKRLAVVRATYHSGAGNWLGAQDFFKQLSEKLSVPQPTPSDSLRGRGGEKYKFTCTGFSVTLAYSFGVSPSVTIADALAQKLLDERNEQNPDVPVKDIRITPGGRPRSPNPPR